MLRPDPQSELENILRGGIKCKKIGIGIGIEEVK